jgi:hypothetical protein
MSYISNKAGTIQFPYEPGLLEWLNENYPYSKYYLVNLE